MENPIVLDCEVYPNYFLLALKRIKDDKILTFELIGEESTFTVKERNRIKGILVQHFTVGFNSRNYDIPIIFYALKGKTAKEICDLSNKIINEYKYGWLVNQKHDLPSHQALTHCDLQEPSPGVMISLKLYGGRLHSNKLQDLPIEPNSTLTVLEMNATKVYCINDLDTTIDLFNQVKERIQLRFDMGEKYNLNLLSKSDAQIAEAVIKQELEKINPNINFSKPPSLEKLKIKSYKYQPPNFIKFETKELQDALELIKNETFKVGNNGSIVLPDTIKKLKIKIGETQYQLGIGGLHSKDKSTSIIPEKNYFLIDKDVASYYPAIILNNKLYPKNLTSSFLNVYKSLVESRLNAKKSGDKVVNESLKIVINGSFGKIENRYSALYSPDLMIAVTLTGQLSLLMLIEQLELSNIQVVSANTDGFVSYFYKEKFRDYESISTEWENVTGFELEETEYKALYSRDVNNYLAVTEKGYKGKGIFTLGDIGKNPSSDICVEAVISLLKDGTPVSKTIKECENIKKFLHVRTVNGGATYKGSYLGRVVRWVYVKNGDTIYYKKPNKIGNHNKVPKSDNSLPIMELKGVPEDLDYERYISESLDILDDIGLTKL